jgi:hypothetical protein
LNPREFGDTPLPEAVQTGALNVVHEVITNCDPTEKGIYLVRTSFSRIVIRASHQRLKTLPPSTSSNAAKMGPGIPLKTGLNQNWERLLLIRAVQWPESRALGLNSPK